jgi:hypothetical protein
VSLALLLAVLSLATFRLTRLITRDDFPPIFYARRWIQTRRPAVVREPARVRIMTGAHRGGYHGAVDYTDYWWLGELVSCPWCASAYISGGLVSVTWFIHGLPLPVFFWLAVWGLGAFLAHLAEQ